ncbi:hypothetical protein DIPPA_21013, partial [Diplonema papillatum]
MATDWPLVLLVLGMCVVTTSAQCQECFDNCGLLFEGWSLTAKISVYDKFLKFFAYDCAFLEDLNAKYPDLRITIVSDADLGNVDYDTKFGVVGDMMDAENPILEIVDMDNPYVQPLADKLETLPEDVYDGIRERFMIRDDDGNVKAISWLGAVMNLYYREDLFKMHNITYTIESWEAWTESLKLLQEKEQERRNDTSWRALIFIAGNNDLSMYTSYLLSFLDGHDGGTVVSEDGEPTINNANAIKTMEMMVDWKKTIMHPKSWVSGSPSDLVSNSDVAVALQWTWYSEWAPAGVTLSPLPGKGSLSGSPVVAITKHTRRKDIAFDIMRRIASNHLDYETSTRWWRGGFRDETTEPVNKDTLNATMWPIYCASQPNLCKAYETYPERFEAPMIPRLRGCGLLFDRCQNVIATGWANLMVEEMPPAQVVAAMDTQLRAVLGIVASGGDAAGIEEWTAERIALIIVIIVACLWIAVLAWFTHDRLRDLRKSNGLRLPASVVLGIVVLVLFCIVQVVITVEWNTAVRRISEDLGSRVQVVLLKTARLSLERSAENKMEEQMALSQMKSLVKADYVSQLPSMVIDSRSLILLIDLDEETIVVSSDTRKQADKVSIAAPYSDEVTNWMHAAFDAVGPTLRGYKTEQLYSSTVGSEKVNVNLQSVSLLKQYNSGEWKKMNYVLIYFVPEEVVYEETTKSLNRAVNLSILLAIVGVVLLVTLAIISTLPLIRLALDMEKVRSMRMDDIDLTQNSRLIEFSSLIIGFQAMCEMLIEYKSFMPKTLFNLNAGSDEDEDSEKVTSTHSKQSRTHSRSSAFGSSSRNRMQTLPGRGRQNVCEKGTQRIANGSAWVIMGGVAIKSVKAENTVRLHTTKRVHCCKRGAVDKEFQQGSLVQRYFIYGLCSDLDASSCVMTPVLALRCSMRLEMKYLDCLTLGTIVSR